MLEDPHISNPNDDIGQVVVIGAGIGCAQTLATVFSELPADFPGTVLVVTNMGKGFTKVLVEKLNSISIMPVNEAVDGQMLRRSRILIVPSDSIASITMFNNGSDTYTMELARSIHSVDYADSLNVLLESAASMFGIQSMAVILSGLGDAGLEGSKHIRNAGGFVLVQDEPSSICYDSPGAVCSAELAHHISPLWQIATHIIAHVKGASHENAA